MPTCALCAARCYAICKEWKPKEDCKRNQLNETSNVGDFIAAD